MTFSEGPLSTSSGSRLVSEAGRKLKELLDATAKALFVVAVPLGAVIVFDLLARRHVRLWVLILAGALLGMAWFRHWAYRRHPDSLRAILAMQNFGMTSNSLALPWAIWAAHVVGSIQWLYDDYAFLYLTVFAAVWVVMTLVLIKRWRNQHALFQDLRTHLQSGTIADYRLHEWLSHRGEKNKWSKTRMSGIIGLMVTGTMLIGALGGRDALGYFLFLASLVGWPALLAAGCARYWLQRKYLQGQDLRVVFT